MIILYNCIVCEIRVFLIYKLCFSSEKIVTKKRLTELLTVGIMDYTIEREVTMKLDTVQDFLDYGLKRLDEVDLDGIYCRYIANDLTYCPGATFKDITEAREFASINFEKWQMRSKETLEQVFC